MKSIKKLEKWLNNVYLNNEKTGKLPKGITVVDLVEIEHIYRVLRGNGIAELISQTVHDVLESCGIAVETKGIGWVAHR